MTIEIVRVDPALLDAAPVTCPADVECENPEPHDDELDCICSCGTRIGDHPPLVKRPWRTWRGDHRDPDAPTTVPTYEQRLWSLKPQRRGVPIHVHRPRSAA